MIRLTQQATLQQKMAPQLIHSLRLLQMPTIELEQAIQQELEINPLLEEIEDMELSEEEAKSEDGQTDSDDPIQSAEETPAQGDAPEASEDGAAQEPVEEAEVPLPASDDPVDASVAATDVDGTLDADDWRDYLNEAAGHTGHREEFDPNEEAWEHNEADRPSMADSLREQLLLTDLSEAEREIAEYLIGNLDDDGFLTVSV